MTKHLLAVLSLLVWAGAASAQTADDIVEKSLGHSQVETLAPSASTVCFGAMNAPQYDTTSLSIFLEWRKMA